LPGRPCTDKGQTVASLRPRTLLGEGRLGIFDVIFARMRAGKRVLMFGSGRNKVQMSDFEDFCAAALAAIRNEATTTTTSAPPSSAPSARTCRP